MQWITFIQRNSSGKQKGEARILRKIKTNERNEYQLQNFRKDFTQNSWFYIWETKCTLTDFKISYQIDENENNTIGNKMDNLMKKCVKEKFLA